MKIKICLLCIVFSALFYSHALAVQNNISFEDKYKQLYKSLPVKSYPDIPTLIKEKKYYELEEKAKTSNLNVRYKTSAYILRGHFDEDESDGSPLMCASFVNDTKILRILDKYGVKFTNPYETVFPAALYDSANAFLYYYDKGLVQKCSDNELIFYIVEGGNTQLLQFLIDKGHKFDFKQKGLIHSAVRSGNIEMIEILLKNGADVNQQYNDKDNSPFSSICGENPTPIDTCFEIGIATSVMHGYFDLDVASYLLEKGANPYINDFFFSVAQQGEVQLDIDTVLSLLRKAKGHKIPQQDKFKYIDYAMARSYLIKEEKEFYNREAYKQYLEETENKLIEIVKLFIKSGGCVSDDAILSSSDYKFKKLTLFLMDNRYKN